MNYIDLATVESPEETLKKQQILHIYQKCSIGERQNFKVLLNEYRTELNDSRFADLGLGEPV